MTRHIIGRATVLGVAIAFLTFATPSPVRAESIGEIVLGGLSRAWGFITGAAESAGDAVTPTPVETLRQMKGEGDNFWSMLEDAGYELKEIDTEVGLIPGIEAKYVLKRELSDSDREALEQRLERHLLENSGLIAKLERAIIYSLLDASELGEYRVDELKVQFLPLPSASFVLAPAEGPLSDEHDRLYRAIREQTKTIRHMDREGHRPPNGTAAARPAATSTPR